MIISFLCLLLCARSHDKMQMKSVLLVVGVLFLVSLVSGCKRTASGESSVIESVKTKIEEMSTEWPSLIGKKAEDAKEIILKERPDLKVYILPEDSMMTMDFRMDRVRIFVDENQIVVKPPKVG